MTSTLITGAGREQGLGFAIAKQLVTEGKQVFLTARRQEQLDPLVEQLRQMGGQAWGIVMDVTSPESIDNAVQEVQNQTDTLDILINNAAYMGDYHSILDDDQQTLQLDFNTNVIGPWLVAKAFHPLLVKSSHPRIVNVSSGAGSFGDTKLALNGVTIKMAKEFASEGILVNSVCPDVTDTHGSGWARPASESAKSVTWAANLPDNGPTGGFFRDGKRLPW